MDENKMMMIINKLKEEFPERCLEPRRLQPINFSQWKVIDIKKFLAIATTMKGISKLKKDDLVMLAMKEWQALCSVSYCGTSSSAADEDLFDVPLLPSPKDELLTTPLCSPTNTVFSSSVPSSPIPTLQRYPTLKENMTKQDFNLGSFHKRVCGNKKVVLGERWGISHAKQEPWLLLPSAIADVLYKP